MSSPVSSGAERRPHTHPIQIAAFRALLVARLTSIIALQGTTIILGWQAYTIARATMSQSVAVAQLGFIGLIQFAALFLVTPWAGLVADRFDRRIVAQLTIFLQLGCAILLAMATEQGWIGLPLIFAIAAALGLARAFQGPALGSLTPNIVPAPLLPRAIATGSIAWQAGAIAGPALAGYAYALQPSMAYMLAGGLFLIATIAMPMIGKVPQSPPDRTRHPLRQILDGIGYVRRNRLVQAAITLDLFAVLLAGTTALLPVYAHDILHVGAAGLGHLAAAPGIGAAATGLLFAITPLRRNVGERMLLAVIVFGFATIIFGATAFMPEAIRMPVAILAMTLWGAADMVSVFIRQSLVQIYTPDAMRGRVGSVSQLTISASNELGEAESGFLAAVIGPTAAVIAGGIGAIAVTLLWSRLYPELRLAKTFDPPDEVLAAQPNSTGAKA